MEASHFTLFGVDEDDLSVKREYLKSFRTAGEPR